MESRRCQRGHLHGLGEGAFGVFEIFDALKYSEAHESAPAWQDDKANAAHRDERQLLALPRDCGADLMGIGIQSCSLSNQKPKFGACPSFANSGATASSFKEFSQEIGWVGKFNHIIKESQQS